MSKCLITVYVGCKTKPKTKKVPFNYVADENPKISDIKLKVSQTLEIPVENMEAYTKTPTNVTAEIEDTEFFDPSDNLWIEATEHNNDAEDLSTSTTNSQSQTNNSTHLDKQDSSQTYAFDHNGVKLFLFKRNTFDEWNRDNDASITVLYEIAKPEEPLYLEQINLYNFFDTCKYRGLIVLAKFKNISPNLLVYDDFQKKLRSATIDLAFKAFNDTKYSEHAKAATTILNKWLQTSFINSWSHGSPSAIGNALKSRGFRDGKRDGRKKIAHGKTVTTAALTSDTFDAVLDAITVSSDFSVIENIYKNTTIVRRSWVNALTNESHSNEDIAEMFFERFTFLKLNAQLIKCDYALYMNKAFQKVPDYGITFTKYAEAIIATAEQQSVAVEEDADNTLNAAEAVVKLINKYSKSKEKCDLSLIILEDYDNTNIVTLIETKNTFTIKPMIIYSNDDEQRQYYIALEHNTVTLTATTFAEALQTLMEVYHTFQIEYDKSSSLFYEFLDFIEGINKSPKACLQNLKTNIDYVYERDVAENGDESGSTTQQ